MHECPQLEAVLLVCDHFQNDLHEFVRDVALRYRTVILAEAINECLEFFILDAKNPLGQLLLKLIEEDRCSFLDLHGRPHQVDQVFQLHLLHLEDDLWLHGVPKVQVARLLHSRLELLGLSGEDHDVCHDLGTEFLLALLEDVANVIPLKGILLCHEPTCSYEAPHVLVERVLRDILHLELESGQLLVEELISERDVLHLGGIDDAELGQSLWRVAASVAVDVSDDLLNQGFLELPERQEHVEDLDNVFGLQQ